MVHISKAKYIPVNKHNMLQQKGFSAFVSVQQCTPHRYGDVPQHRHCYHPCIPAEHTIPLFWPSTTRYPQTATNTECCRTRQEQAPQPHLKRSVLTRYNRIMLIYTRQLHDLHFLCSLPCTSHIHWP